MPWLGLLTPTKYGGRPGAFSSQWSACALLGLLASALLAWSPAFAQTECQPPPPGMSCAGDRLVWCNLPSLIYHFQGERYFGCTKTGKFECERDAIREGCRSTHLIQ